MKKKIFFLLFVALACLPQLYGQNVNIPDVNFKNKLIALGIDTNADGQIQVSEALAVTYLDVSSSSINSMVGIEAFTNLINLKCGHNPFVSLDVSTLTNLQRLICTSYYSGYLTSLDVSALVNLQYLDCGNNQIANLTIAGLTQLDTLTCYVNNLTSLDVSTLTSLQFLNCDTNDLANLDVSTLVNLQYLTCRGNLLTSLDVSTLANLSYLDCSYNDLGSLDVSGLTNLEQLICIDCNLTNLDMTGCIGILYLSCNDNQLTIVDLTSLTNVLSLVCWNNLLSSLDVSSCTNIQGLYCGNNLLTNLDVSSCPNMQWLWCDYNQIQSLDVSSCPNIQGLYCSNNLINSLQVNGCTNLQEVRCNDNQLTSLDLWSCINLGTLYCYDNQLTSLDLSNCTNMYHFLSYDNSITALFMKNGKQEIVDFHNNPLQYICADMDEFGYLQQRIAQYGMTNVYVSSLCTFAPGGNHNTVSGTNRFDGDINGCTVADSAAPYLMIAVTDGIDTIYRCGNTIGYYEVYVDTGIYSFTPHIQNPAYFSGVPVSSNINFSNNNNNLQSQDFCLVPIGIFPDVEIVAMSVHGPLYKLLVHNKGNTIASGNVIFDFMGNKMTVISTSIAPSNQTTNQLSWIYSNLEPLEYRSINIYMDILPPPTNNIGDTLDFAAHISLLNDVDSSDNYSAFSQDVQYAFDPNDKTCLEGSNLPNTKIGEYLHYLIRFQNTGTASSEKVVVIDSIDASKFDISSLQIMEASHPVEIRVENNVIEFYFDNIMLPDSFADEPGSHGHILFKIKTKNSLPLNSTVANKVEIYFDYNLPVVTNTAVTTFSTCSAGYTSMGNVQDVTCNGLCDGAISVNVGGGTQPYISSWSNGVTGASINGLCAGTYQQTIVDGAGCVLTNSFSIAEPTPLNAAIGTIIGTVNNQNGEIQITVSGATAPYTFLWSNGQTTQNATQLSAGIYAVTVTDANGCDTTISNINVTEIVRLEWMTSILFTVYPNPSQRALSIESSEAVDLLIYNSLGEIVITKRVQGKENLDISMLPKGVYWIQQRNTHNGRTFVKE